MVIKKILRYINHFLGFIFALSFIYLVTAIVLSLIPVKGEEYTRDDVEIFLQGNGAHIDIVMPVNTIVIDWSQIFQYQKSLDDNIQPNYISVGWGDREFYINTPQWSDLKLGTALKAIFGLGKTAFHISYYEFVREGEDCIKLELTNEQYSRLVRFILKDLTEDTSGNAIVIETNGKYGVNDIFFESDGRYSMFYTCNTWVNSALKSCGQKACLWTPFQEGLSFQYK